MKYFKVKAKHSAPRYRITSNNFVKYTLNKYPFEQVNSSGSLSQYAICPSCSNTIQLIGLTHATKVTPHGKHTGKSIKGFTPWNQQKYIFCPFAKHSEYIPPNDEMLLPNITKDVIELYELLKNNFDRAVFLLEKSMNIKCSNNFWRKSLLQYITNKTYLYPWLTEANLPYVFALRGMTQQSCFGQQFVKDSSVFYALSKYQGIKFVASYKNNYEVLRNNESKFIKPVFRLTNHKQTASTGDILKETMDLYIDDNSNGITIYKKRIEFDETFFQNLIHSKSANVYRNKELLNLASEIMTDIS